VPMGATSFVAICAPEAAVHDVMVAGAGGDSSTSTMAGAGTDGREMADTMAGAGAGATLQPPRHLPPRRISSRCVRVL